MSEHVTSMCERVLREELVAPLDDVALTVRMRERIRRWYSDRAFLAEQAKLLWERADRLRKPWRDFATAPRDGRDVLAWRSDAGVFIASCTLADDGETDVWFSVDGEDLTGDLPSLWMPLPEPPASKVKPTKET